MKLKRIAAALLAALCLTALLPMSASAADLNDPRFDDKTWEEIMAQFLLDHDVAPEQVTAGYYNTVTGEEHYHNPDQLMYGASVAKLPTNMLYAERIYNGEMTFDDKIRGNSYRIIQRLSIVNSDNPSMELMVNDLGGGNYREFRKQILPYIGETEETVEDSFLNRNFFTPKQIMYTLKLLYEHPDHYPGVLDCMKLASPHDYFRASPVPYEIAHKYGWYTDHGVTYLNDSAIVYTDDPILLVLFTGNVHNNREVLADYCTLMSEYAQYSHEKRVTESYLDTALAEDYHYAQPITFLRETETGYVKDVVDEVQVVCFGVALAAIIFGLTQAKDNRKSFMLSVLLAVALVVVGAMSPTWNVRQSVKAGEPLQVANDFAATYARDGRWANSLYNGEEIPAETEFQKTFASSLQLEAHSCKLRGKHAVVQVSGTRLSMSAYSQALHETTLELLPQIVASPDCPPLFDDEGKYLPDAAQLAMREAHKLVLEQYPTEAVSGTLEMVYTTEGWKIVVTGPLMTMVNYS